MKTTYPAVAVARSDSPLGPLLLAATERGLSGLWFEDQRHLPPWLATRLPASTTEHPVLNATTRQLLDYFAGERDDFDLPLDLVQGTDFQRAPITGLLYTGSAVVCGAFAAMAGLLIWRHAENIRRLMNGSESRIGRKKTAAG